MVLPKIKPMKTANNPNRLLAIILKKAILYSLERIRTIVSSAKDEKVVKPPNNPVKIKAFEFAEKL